MNNPIKSTFQTTRLFRCVLYTCTQTHVTFNIRLNALLLGHVFVPRFLYFHGLNDIHVAVANGVAAIAIVTATVIATVAVAATDTVRYLLVMHSDTNRASNG